MTRLSLSDVVQAQEARQEARETMPRYCVNAAVTVDAWAYVEAETPADAAEKAVTLTARDYELGDPVHVRLESVTLDA